MPFGMPAPTSQPTAHPSVKTRLLCAVALVLPLLLSSTGCSPQSSPDLTALQGTWTGTAKGQTTPSKLVISGRNLHFEGLEGGTWYDGTLALEPGTPRKLRATISKSSVEKHTGKAAGFIYKVENGTLTLAGLAPGQNAYPTGFEDPAARVFTLKKQGN